MRPPPSTLSWLTSGWQAAPPKPCRVNHRDMVAYALRRAAEARRAGSRYWASFWLQDARRLRRQYL